MAYYFINIEEQLHSVLDALTKAAVSEIGRLIEDAATGLRLEIIRSHKENETLSMKLQEKERELRAVQGDRMQTDEVKDAFERNYSLLSVEKDIRQCVVAQQTDEVLNQVLVKKEQVEVEEDLKSDWKSDIFEAEESSGAGSVPGLKQDGAPAAEAGLQPGLVMDLGQVGWSEPVEQEGDVGSDGQSELAPRRSARARKGNIVYNDNNDPENEDDSDFQPLSKFLKNCLNLQEREPLGDFRKSEANRLILYRATLAEEKRKASNKKAAERMQRYRKRQKEKQKFETGKRLTREERQSMEEKKKTQREYWRIKKAEYRSRQSAQDKQREKEKRRKLYKETNRLLPRSQPILKRGCK
ncbi:hypothetical protein GJAV_G00001000 [Gymnothorax javanicus]|nr:hypothetical protein GJAV_G00001000 [Gymnothorax javanicus]